MLIEANDEQAAAVLARYAAWPVLAVAKLSPQWTLEAFDRLVLRRDSMPDRANVADPSSVRLATLFPDAGVRTHMHGVAHRPHERRLQRAQAAGRERRQHARERTD